MESIVARPYIRRIRTGRLGPSKRGPSGPASGIDDALAALEAEDLREVIHEMLADLDERASSRAVSAIISRAARGANGWVPAAASDAEVTEALDFVAAARRVGSADPVDVDDCLTSGSSAFLRKDYAAAAQIFGALLPAVGQGDIDLGQHELVDEVLGVNLSDCAAQYVLAVYMTAAPAERAEAVRSAIDEVRELGNLAEPLGEMERVAVEPLRDLPEFLPTWRTLIEGSFDRDRHPEWDADQDRWLREVVQRMEGTRGLERLARSSTRATDLRAWCQSLVASRDWKAALAAFDEAATLVGALEHARGEFLDGAALAAHELHRPDLVERLDRAWRAAPTMLRLRRWLGAPGTQRAIKARVANALEACPKGANRQRALLFVILGDWKQAAGLLGAAPGLGWSNDEHPGHLLFPLFAGLLGGEGTGTRLGPDLLSENGLDLDDWEACTGQHVEPRLAAPEVWQILDQAGVSSIPDDSRKVVLRNMRKAAEHRVAGVTGQKRRNHYGHAAELVAACVAADPSPDAAAWLAGIRDGHRRFYAFRAELDARVKCTRS